MSRRNAIISLSGKLKLASWFAAAAKEAKIIRIENISQPLSAPLQAIYCDSFIRRLRGFMFRYSLTPEEGLLLVKRRESCLGTSIHMLFVNMNLAVIWINSEFTVVDAILACSWHSAYVPRQRARFTLEIHPNRLNEFKIGDHLEFQHA